MTRNNLNEHLQWLLTSQAMKPKLQPVNPRNATDDHERHILQREARLRVEGQTLSSAVVARPAAQNDSHQPDRVPHNTSRVNTTMANINMKVSDDDTSFDEFLDSDVDIEVMDLTADDAFQRSPPVPQRTMKQIVPRKRHSDEFEDVDGDSEVKISRAGSREPQKQPPQKIIALASKDDVVPSQPPPYSTHPPAQQSRHNSEDTSVKVAPLTAVPTPAVKSKYSIIDDDKLFDFSDSSTKPVRILPTPRQPQKVIVQPDVVDQARDETESVVKVGSAPEKPCLPANQEKSKLSPPVDSHRDLLDSFLALPTSYIDEAIKHFSEKQDQLSDQMVNLIDSEDIDVDIELELELDRLRVLVDNLQALREKSIVSSGLSQKKQVAMERMKQAVKNRQNDVLAEARKENASIKIQLADLRAECLPHIKTCEAEITEACRKFQHEKPTAVVDVQASPLPPSTPAAVLPTQSRVLQTQTAMHLPQDQVNTTTSNTTSKSRAVMGPPQHPVRNMNTAITNHVYEIDEDEFNTLDDDFMEIGKSLDYGRQNRTINNHSRPALTEISNNRNVSQRQKNGKNDLVTHDDPQFAELFSHPWSNDVKRVLRECFHLKGFRQGQLEAINATLAGHDTFVLMPTGGGKSLCYQLPSQIASGKTNGVTIVISPLLSLMEDQTQHLRKLNVQALLVNGETPQESRREIMNAMRRRDVKKFMQVLYVTPEMLTKSQAMISAFDALFANKMMARIVIDEVHCVSQWGHDFRPDYTMIGDVRRKYPSVPVMALTATATKIVKADIINNLAITGCKEFTRSFNRPNLHYQVLAKLRGKETISAIAELIRTKHARQTGIIYCLSRDGCQRLAQTLSKDYKIKATHYHAGLTTEEKSKVQTSWQAGSQHIIVATIAFGMGIDKPNVRFVIHFDLPKSLEGYYQETGRAGRDGQASWCYLYYSGGDVVKLRRMIDSSKEADFAQKRRQNEMISKMADYCGNKADCRRVQVLAYFNESFDRKNCNNGCDNCSSGIQVTRKDCTELGRAAINIARILHDENVTLLNCVDVLRGKKHKVRPNKNDDDATKKSKQKHESELNQALQPYTGLGADLDRGDVSRLFYKLAEMDYLSEEQVFNGSKFPQQYIRMGSKRDQVRNITLDIQSSPSASRTTKTVDVAEASTKSRGKKRAVEIPTSTNVSSPIQANMHRMNMSDVLKGKTFNDYELNGFVVADDSKDELSDESEAFEPVYVQQEKKKAQRIVSDGVLDALSEKHQVFADDFAYHANELAKEIMSEKDMNRPLFSTTIFRQMAIDLCDTPEGMKKIAGIDARQVDYFGAQFLKLLKDARTTFESMNTQFADPNAQVIQISSDDEDDHGEDCDEDDDSDYGSIDDLDLVAASQMEVDSEVAAFNQNTAQSQSAAMRVLPSAPSAKKSYKGKGKSYRATGSGSYSARPAGQASGRGKWKKRSYSKKSTAGGNGRASKASNSRFQTMPT